MVRERGGGDSKKNTQERGQMNNKNTPLNHHTDSWTDKGSWTDKVSTLYRRKKFWCRRKYKELGFALKPSLVLFLDFFFASFLDLEDGAPSFLSSSTGRRGASRGRGTTRTRQSHADSLLKDVLQTILSERRTFYIHLQKNKRKKRKKKGK
jgi:hypothetical protein